MRSHNIHDPKAAAHVDRIEVTSLAVGMTVVGLYNPWDNAGAPTCPFTIESQHDVDKLKTTCESVYVEVAPESSIRQPDKAAAQSSDTADRPPVLWDQPAADTIAADGEPTFLKKLWRTVSFKKS